MELTQAGKFHSQCKTRRYPRAEHTGVHWHEREQILYQGYLIRLRLADRTGHQTPAGRARSGPLSVASAEL